ncbi:LON peptidase N-terminal domain and RING finger protein 3-like [Boleophthalmus pectinirostris]|uniref:LON peptidase N-terminal domain and RING finger protein 3-like n=1 Tax=Boleophthalmus pectinirostris TaxID=150288 RepID=UPI002430CE5B|nr:LON peptidase N-terminal domain and RING finger protein 3-like [Boleophthalmus pectinirostris]
MESESAMMLQLASEAFRAHNFDLAAEIYECQAAGARDARSRQELMVRRADALAFAGKFAEAFRVYRSAAEVERLRPAHLDRLIDCLVDGIRRQEHTSRSSLALLDSERSCGGGGGVEALDVSCPLCLGFLFEPVTLACGHCFCKRCLERERPLRCAVCRRDGAGAADGYRVNVVLSGLLSKLYPGRERAVRLRREGSALYVERRVEEALHKYDQAIAITPLDHLLFSNRSLILSALKRLDQALSDACTALNLRPKWAKGHMRKAQVLLSLGRPEEALRDYLTYLSLDPDYRPARTEAQKLLSEILAPVSDQVSDQVLDSSGILTSRVLLKTSTALHQCDPADLWACPVRSKVRGHVEAGLLKRKRHSSDDDDETETKRTKTTTTTMMMTESLSPVAVETLDPCDVECSLCMRLFLEPVTTPCGHTFCLQCLERCLDHNPKCPLCKEELSEFLERRQFCRTLLMEKLISKHLPTELRERQKIHQEEMDELSNLNKSVPIFVCTMAFPTVPCPLHIFEPCYRLMIRRCMETGTNRFGMCLGDKLKGFADFGCLLEIRDVKFFSDGRSVVDTIGRRRFRVLKHQERDGYNTADIEYLEDVKVEGAAAVALQTLHDSVYELGLLWVNSLRPEQKERIEGHFGPMPPKETEIQSSPNGPSWCWWLLAVLPLEGRAQLPFLALTSLKDRLSGLRKVLLFMSQSRNAHR